MAQQAAQNQHYVPKFVLRNFLIDERKELVAAFSKRTGEVFTPSIKGIMAERRFHEFVINDEFRASFEDAIGRIEDVVLPVYRRIVAEERLAGTAEERALLGFLMAFQLVRTRSQRDQFLRMEELLSSKLERMGASLSDLEGWEPLDDDTLTHHHIHIVRDTLPHFSAIIAAKDFVLLKAPAGRAFYLSDNPVALHNELPSHPLIGNVGLKVKGIQIYMPLSPSLTLAAWCPSLLEEMRGNAEFARRSAAGPLLAELQAGRITAEQMRRGMEAAEGQLALGFSILAAAAAGEPVAVPAANVDYCNSLQVWSAREFILCQRQDFALARGLLKDNPGYEGFRLGDASEM